MAHLRSRRFWFPLLFTLAVATPLIAHDTWLAPGQFRFARPGAVTLSLSSGMEFPKLDHAIASDRLASATWRSSRGAGILPAARAAAHALELRVDAGKGVTAFSVVLLPRPSKLKREQVREYVHHLGIPNADAIYAEWERTSRLEETSYRYVKYTKTFVRIGSARESRVWNEPDGMRLELVPQNDPTSIVSGGKLGVLLLDQGKPLPNYPVVLIREGAKEPIASLTDAGGRVRLTLSGSGRYMLRATTLESSAENAITWDVHFTTMTFYVAPGKPKRP